MAKMKLIIEPSPSRVESGPVVGFALHLNYKMAEPEEAGYGFFDDDLLEVIKKNFVALNEHRFNITYETPIPGFTRVFMEFKGKA